MEEKDEKSILLDFGGAPFYKTLLPVISCCKKNALSKQQG
jgi:hypothetical protein